MSSQYFAPYGSSSNNIKVQLNLSSYATKIDLKNITHVDMSSYASKVNLAALKTEVDKIDTDKLKTVPDDLAKLSNVVKNDVVKKTDYNTKVTSIESQIAGVTKNTLDNLGDITKLKAVDTNNFVLKTKISSDVTTLENKIDTVDKKIPDISGLATKTSLTSYLQTATFNFKVTEVENKIKATDIIAKSANTKANTIRSNLTGYAKKADVATDITAIKTNVLVNKCSGSCNTLDDPMARLCVPNIIKNVNMKVYNFLMRLNETCNVLWHESCKCVCRLNSLVCNSKQIWNSDTCRCDCNEDFADIINCTKGYMWNPSTCACECDMWCKPGQYLEQKNCVCKNKLIGRVIAECANVINETMMNNKKNYG